tara:strand:+ start:430 stop:819 length:390 start_codon:yes stop_codon:yes gene_type:complete
MKKVLRDNFKDKRGRIIDIFIRKPKDHCTLVTFNKGATRGNHFHKKSIQYSFVITGKLIMMSAKVNKSGNIFGKIKKEILKKNTIVVHKPYYAHAFKATTKVILLAFADGKRGGKDYEKDTFRLKTKLI